METQAVIILLGVFAGISDALSVLEGHPVTLNTNVVREPHKDIKWFFKDVRIAQVNGDLSFNCTDVKCNEGTEIFRDRLKLDFQTGSLTIMNSRITDSGNYTLDIIVNGNHREKIFSVSVHGMSAAPQDDVRRLSVIEGGSVTLDTGGMREPNNGRMTWYFNATTIAELIEGQSKICTSDKCKETFGGGLKLDNHTGSLTITNIKTKQAGLYELQILSNTSSISRQRRDSATRKNFHVEVLAADTGPSAATVAVVCVIAAILVFAAAGMYYCRHQTRSYTITTG